MSVARWLEYKIDVDPKKPGRRQEVFDLKAIEKALGAPITHVYSNQIQPGATAGMHYHKVHQVAVWMREDVKTHKRSEEHTSELQSLAYLVCRLLLEKKKKDGGLSSHRASGA